MFFKSISGSCISFSSSISSNKSWSYLGNDKTLERSLAQLVIHSFVVILHPLIELTSYLLILPGTAAVGKVRISDLKTNQVVSVISLQSYTAGKLKEIYKHFQGHTLGGMGVIYFDVLLSCLLNHKVPH